MRKFVVYILRSEKTDAFYIGHSQDVGDRLKRHNEGKSRSTSRGVPWRLVWCHECSSRSEAMKLEKWIKSMKSRSFIEKLIANEIDLKEWNNPN